MHDDEVWLGVRLSPELNWQQQLRQQPPWFGESDVVS